MSTPLPTFKLESADTPIKPELHDTPSPAAISDTYMDDADGEDPDLDVTNANTPFWLAKLPRHLWEALSKAGDNDDDEVIELGTIRVEGSLRDPQRVSLRLNHDLPIFHPPKDGPNAAASTVERDFVLQTTAKNNPHRRVRYPGSTLLFSEKNLPGFKPRGNIWDAAEAASNHGQGRSNLFDETVRAAKRKENNNNGSSGGRGRYVPYQRKPIPKITALVGVATEEFEVRAARTGENKEVEERRVRAELDAGRRRGDAMEIRDHNRRLEHATIATAAERASMRKVRHSTQNLVAQRQALQELLWVFHVTNNVAATMGQERACFHVHAIYLSVY